MAKYTRQLSWNTNSKTVEPDRPQRDLPAACVVSKQYSSAILFSLRSHSRKEKFGSSLFQFSPFFLCVGLKLRKLGSVLFSSVTHSRIPPTYILPSGETPNFTPISHKWKNYSSVQITVSVLDIKPEVKILNGILRCNLRMKSALYCFVHVANKSYVFLLYLCIHPLS